MAWGEVASCARYIFERTPPPERQHHELVGAHRSSSPDLFVVFGRASVGFSKVNLRHFTWFVSLQVRRLCNLGAAGSFACDILGDARRCAMLMSAFCFSSFGR